MAKQLKEGMREKLTSNLIYCGVNEEEVPVVEKAEKFLYIL